MVLSWDSAWFLLVAVRLHRLVSLFEQFGAQSEGKGRPGTGHEGQEKYSSALDVGGWSTPRPGRLTPGKETRHLL